MASSEIIELHNRKGEILLTTQKQQNFPDPIIRKMNIPKTDWILVYKTEAPPLQGIYLTFTIITFVTAIIIAVLAVFLTSLVAKRFAHDFVRISSNLARAVQGKKSGSNDTLHLKETDDMMPIINNIANQIRKKQQSLLELSLTDDLTGLPNRRSLQAVIKQIANFPARGIQTCVCIIDIDYFKKINDQFGHLIGDAILIALSNSLKKAQRASDFISRMGGDEFIVVLIDMDKNRIEEWLNRIRSEFRNDASKDADVVPADMRSLSCGYVCLQPDGDLTLSSILKMADEALYEAKARGRDTIVQYQAPTS
jgi:diguanylate cyclase (GGDEF)-like protein